MNNPYIFLAKLAVESYVKEGKIIEPPKNLPEEFLTKKSGTFVSIFRSTRETNARLERETDAKKELRGCIGTYLPTKKNIAEEIIHNAIAAATEDYRFGPIQKEELPYLSYTVYILSEPELVNPHTTTRIISLLRRERQSSFGVGVKDIAELDPRKYGIIVKTLPITNQKNTDVVFNGHLPSKTGLLLPDLDGVDTVEKQLSIAYHKAGIDAMEEKIFIYKFTVEKFR